MNQILWYSISCQRNTERPFAGLAPFFVAGRVFLPFTRPYIERGIYYAVYL